MPDFKLCLNTFFKNLGMLGGSFKNSSLKFEFYTYDLETLHADRPHHDLTIYQQNLNLASQKELRNHVFAHFTILITPSLFC